MCNLASKNINAIWPLCLGNFVIMWNPKSKRVYIGEVLNILRQGKGRYGSITEADGVTGISALSLQVYRAIHIDDDEASVIFWIY